MTTSDTSGFYRPAGSRLSYAPNAVIAPTYTLRRADKDEYEYPVEGWYWFDSAADAKEFFGIPQPGG
jgi:hypothetical protein